MVPDLVDRLLPALLLTLPLHFYSTCFLLFVADCTTMPTVLHAGEDVAVQTKGVERRSDSPKPPEPSNFGGEVIVGDAHADAFAEHVDNVTVLNTDNFHDIVMNPHKDVLVILQAHDSKDCQVTARI